MFVIKSCATSKALLHPWNSAEPAWEPWPWVFRKRNGGCRDIWNALEINGLSKFFNAEFAELRNAFCLRFL